MKIKRIVGLWCRAKPGEYPWCSMLLALGLILLAPFAGASLNYAALLVCLYRLLRYPEAVFATDYCILSSLSYIFITPARDSLFAWLCLGASVRYLLKRKLMVTKALLWLAALVGWLLLRAKGAWGDTGLMMSQLLLLHLLLVQPEEAAILRSAKAFCASMVLSSAYALVFRSTPQLRSLLGPETAPFLGSSLFRFHGLFRDPNYYMSLLLVAIALLISLYVHRKISGRTAALGAGAMMVFGALTGSKSFLLILAAEGLAYFACLRRRRKHLLAAGSLLFLAAAGWLAAETVLAVTLERFTSAQSLYELTTGRNVLLADYWQAVTESVPLFLFGRGMSAELLRRGPHNLYLEILYFTGAVGLGLGMCYVRALLRLAESRMGKAQSPFCRYLVLAVFCLTFCTLQGMTFPITYVMLYLAIGASVLRGEKEEGLQWIRRVAP